MEYTEDGTIVSAGVCRDPASEQDFRKGALMPGFVNSHCHLELSHLKGKFRKGTGMSGFINQINELRDFTSAENRMAEAARWLDILWRQGVSAMADISNCDETFMMKSASPLYTRTFLEVFGTEPEDCGQVIASVRNLAEKAASYGIDAAPTPHACYTMSPELLTAASAEGLAAGYLSYHSEESCEEDELMESGTGPLAENYRGRNLSTPPVTGRQSLFYFIDRLLKVHQPPFDEHILLEQRDGVWRILVRTHYGIGQAFSDDCGRTWRDIGDSRLGGPDSRFALRRLKSGKLLLINHQTPLPLPGETPAFQREKLTAWLSSSRTTPRRFSARKRVSWAAAPSERSGRIR